ncbi:hypothetical protein SZ64_11020 [Erythrobacter sp. SG61-1L]|uniref:hypothetical protein n=1 Tax=Erythrobacter sp. SG61-1L TaxID=1603897 RepID=UPI0006C90220|nr:hypothetical protein [Erythrobacter sp. SG61-1L]KPL68588.1 hypothetical protein SZ64_11020 [Erythrobacter sp. SG61-1L]
MHALRTLILGNRRTAIVVLLLALCMKALIPAGYMVAGGSKSIAVTICNGVDGALSLATIEVPVRPSPFDGKSDHGKGKEGGQCSFSSLSMAAMGGADAPLLALALAFILLLGLRPAARLPFRRADYLQPPLRGPPATA